MTRAEMLELLRDIQWAGGLPEPWCEGVVSCCPSCENEAGAIHDRVFALHNPDCKLDKAIAWLADENNRDTFTTDGARCKAGWVLR